MKLSARNLQLPFFRAAIAGFARQACEILIQAGCYINEDKACSQKIQLAYCSNALRSIPLWAPSRSSVSLCQMRSPQEGTEIWDILASRPAALFRFFPFVFLCFLVPDVQVQILASHHRWHHRHAFAWVFHTERLLLRFCVECCCVVAQQYLPISSCCSNNCSPECGALVLGPPWVSSIWDQRPRYSLFRRPSTPSLECARSLR